MKYTVAVPHHDYDGVLYKMSMHISTLFQEVNDWLGEEIGNRGDTWDWYESDEFVFLNETDAVAFKLRWL